MQKKFTEIRDESTSWMKYVLLRAHFFGEKPQGQDSDDIRTTIINRNIPDDDREHER